MSGSGNAKNESPIKKWPGVRTDRSKKSFDKGVRGLKCTHALIWACVVYLGGGTRTHVTLVIVF